MQRTMVGLACLAAQAASAEPLAPRQGQPGIGPRGSPVRIDSTLAIQLPLAAGAGVEEQVRQTEAARKAIYEMAARECAVLVEVFKSDCRLLSLRANSNVQSRGNATEQVFVSGSATYELVERPN